MRARWWSAVVMLAAVVTLAGCGGDNVEFCKGCGSPSTTVTFTPAATPSSTATGATPSATPTPDLGLF